ncbi:MAG: 3'-5' exonuclease [Gammaproteobacteria bacterium]|nr:MAG: 3'-5' exonuclease [Gammaproteobacteria bacterium]
MTAPWLNRMLALCGMGHSMTRAPAPDTPLNGMRMVVVDVETTGLNLRKDSVISIGAVAVVNGRLKLSESFDQTLQVDVSLSKDNVLIHGITPSDVSHGRPAREVMQAFLDYLDGAPLIAFHALFDKKMLEKAVRTHLDERCQLAAYDLAEWLPAFFPEHTECRRMGLDDWIERLNIPVNQRHNAIEDAMATAQLLQKCLARARQQGLSTWGELMQVVKTSRRKQTATHHL